MTTFGLLRLALGLSLALNVLLIALIALYVHYAGLLDLVETAVGILN